MQAGPQGGQHPWPTFTNGQQHPTPHGIAHRFTDLHVQMRGLRKCPLWLAQQTLSVVGAGENPNGRRGLCAAWQGVAGQRFPSTQLPHPGWSAASLALLSVTESWDPCGQWLPHATSAPSKCGILCIKPSVPVTLSLFLPAGSRWRRITILGIKVQDGFGRAGALGMSIALSALLKK